MCFSFYHRGIPADIQVDIDEDREAERIYSLFTLSLLKLQKMEGKPVLYCDKTRSFISNFWVISLIFFKVEDIYRFPKLLIMKFTNCQRGHLS